jgi:hypothetical protein
MARASRKAYGFLSLKERRSAIMFGLPALIGSSPGNSAGCLIAAAILRGRPCTGITGSEQKTREEKLVSYLLCMPVDPGSCDIAVFEVDRAEVPEDLALASPEPGRVAAKAAITLEEALGKLKPSLQKITSLLKDLSPDEAEVEFGLKMGGETGVVVAKGTAEVNFTVRMSWKSAQKP